MGGKGSRMEAEGKQKGSRMDAGWFGDTKASLR